MSALTAGVELPAAMLGPCPHSRQTAFPASNWLLIKQDAVPPLRPLRTPLRTGPNPNALLPPEQPLSVPHGGPCAGLSGPGLAE